MKFVKPKDSFKPKKKNRVEYRTVSYRLPAAHLDALESYVDKDTSACSLITQLLEWGFPEIGKALKDGQQK